MFSVGIVVVEGLEGWFLLGSLAISSGGGQHILCYDHYVHCCIYLAEVIEDN